jgi:hypothetical protein
MLAIAARPPAPPKPHVLTKQALYKIAAGLLLAVGIVSLAYQVMQYMHPGNRQVVKAPVPTQIAQLLAADHDKAAAAGTLAFDLPRNPDELAKAIQSKLNLTPLVAPVGRGFTLQGAQIVDLGGTSAAHLFYTNGSQSISVYNLPASAMPSYPCDVTLTGDDAPLPTAGFIHNDGAYVVVGSSSDHSLTAADVKAIRNALRPNIPGAVCTPD